MVSPSQKKKNGKKAKNTLKSKARLFAEKINKEERKNKAELIAEPPGKEPAGFWTLLGIRSNYTQLRMLVEYMNEHKNFARGDCKGHGPADTRNYLQQWEDLKEILKKYGPDKTIEQWRHTWRDLKKKARDEALTIHSSRTSTGKLSFTPRISDMSAKILSIVERDYPVDLLRSEEPSEDCVGNLLRVRSAIAQRRLGNCSTRRIKIVDNGFDPLPQDGDEGRDHEEVLIEDKDDSVEATEVAVEKLERPKTSGTAAVDIKIAVIPEGFPTAQFQRDGWAAFVPIMFAKLEESTPLPGVDVEGIVAGAIHISCKKNSDVEWVRNNFDGEIIDGRKVKVVKIKDLPKPIKMEWQTRNYVITDSSRVLRLMQRAHPILRTAEWQVVETIVEEGLIRRIVLMDRISADYIKSWECKLSNGMCTDNFKILEDFVSSDGQRATSSRECNDSLIENESDASQQSPSEEQCPKREIESPTIEVQEVWLTSEDVGENLDHDSDTDSQYTTLTVAFAGSDEDASVERC